MPYFPGNLPPIHRPVAPGQTVSTPNDGTAGVSNQGSYITQTLNLATAVNYQKLQIGPGNFIQVVDGSPGMTATLFIDQASTGIPVYPGWYANVAFNKAYITFPAQAGMGMTMLSSPVANFSGA